MTYTTVRSQMVRNFIPPNHSTSKDGVKANGCQKVQQNEWIMALRETLAGDTSEDLLEQVKFLLSEGKYDCAVTFVEEKRQEVANSHDIVCADLDTHYAKALIYTGETGKAIKLLKGIITQWEGRRSPEEMTQQSKPHTSEGQYKNLVLGRAHNHLGYAYWMNLGYYNSALQEFCIALTYFRASNWPEGYANTCDNMGRVYALLNQPRLALLLINYGLELRKTLGDDYRIALSLNSLAITYLRSGKLYSARILTRKALNIFKELNRLRGVGLAYITLGRLLRQLGSSDKLKQAEKYLKFAVNIFEESVDESIRLMEAYKELGCIYRDQAVKTCCDSDKLFTMRALCNAERCFREATRLSKGKNMMLYLDSCQDLAQIHFQRHQFDDAEYWLATKSQASNFQF